jgi:hypothetical protein
VLHLPWRPVSIHSDSSTRLLQSEIASQGKVLIGCTTALIRDNSAIGVMHG